MGEPAAFRLTVLPGEVAICRLDADSAAPEWAWGGPFTSVTRTADELSVVCTAAQVPGTIQATRGWRCLKVEGPFELETTVGVLTSLSATLAAAGVSIFVVGTYDTDYLLVKGASLAPAVEALRHAGNTVSNGV